MPGTLPPCGTARPGGAVSPAEPKKPAFNRPQPMLVAGGTAPIFCLRVSAFCGSIPCFDPGIWPTLLSAGYKSRFAGVARVFGDAALESLAQAHFCIVGIGGVGSWAAEACARSGIGAITLIDHDDIDIGNTNRQLHTTADSLGRSKVEVLRERILAINPDCDCRAIDDLVTRGNVEKFEFRRYDYVIDAIDHASHKLALMHYCRRNKVRFVSTGGAGGLTDPTCIEVRDLTLSYNDPLLAKVRATLRHQLGYSRNPKRRYAMDCVFSTEQPLYPAGDGSVSHAKPEMNERATLDCAGGIGSFVGVTACFGFTAAAHAMRKFLKHSRAGTAAD